ncbi:recombinase family protein [Aeromicrobium sp. 179-A 4D2 NHS]|uniref:recombinase family protein n=1 Tax=Aeromicrobium sp. 179-A 4D2 NHS TaxID=3142375 RepID=UPI0039A1DFF7
MVHAAIYTRLSVDKDGDGLGVGRQLEDCRALARNRGWRVVAEFEDNDVSAYSGKERPGYRQMLARMDAGEFNAIILYNQDRLTRRPREFEDFAERFQAAKVQHFATCSGDLDFAQGDNLLTARIFAAAAAHQSDAASRRIKRKNDERAAKGLPHAGGRRAFGYTSDGLELVEVEAAAFRRAAERYIAGEPVVSILRTFEDEGIHTTTGAAWRLGTLTKMLASPRYAALVQRHGEIIGEGVWPAIITRHQHEQIIARRNRDRIVRPRANRTHLLTGLLRCGRCGHMMVSQSLPKGGSIYRCNPAPDTPGCGGMSIRAHLVEDLIARAVLTRLDTPQLLTDVTDTSAEEAEARELEAVLTDLRRRQDDLTDMFIQGQIERHQLARGNAQIADQIEATTRRLATLTTQPALRSLIGDAESLADLWNDPDMTIQRQNAIIRAVLEHVTIHEAGKKGGSRFDPRRVEPIWRA